MIKLFGPFEIHIIPLDKEGTPAYDKALEVLQKLEAKGYDCLFDDRGESPGSKFKDADLIGIRNRIVVGRKASEGIFEYKNLANDNAIEVTLDDLMEMEF